jgi:phenylalanyl-tRNA synthetase alpha chain
MKGLQQQFEHALLECKSVKDIEALKLRYLGKKGIIQDQMRQLREVSPDERPAVGAKVNSLKVYIEDKLDQFLCRIVDQEREQQMAEEHLDVTLPGRKRFLGSKHPITATIDEIVGILKDLGFSVQVGPQIETEYYNFEVLNFALDHPARDMQDTFYIEPGVLLRTHTSNVQGRVMERTSPPIRIACPGRCFRNEEVSARSHCFFHQVEALYIDQGVTMQDLFWTFREFVQRLFQRDDLEVRFRPSYFPFVEPGTECDATCLVCNGKGCQLCKYSGWLEICGAGMVHPQVLRNVGIDAEKYQGYAWGMGVERLIMLRHSIRDIRLFSENDMRFLNQFYGA